MVRDQVVQVGLRYSPLSPTATPMIVHRNSACASLNPLNVAGLLLIPNPGIAESLLTVSMSTVDLVQNPSNSQCSARATNGSSYPRMKSSSPKLAINCKRFI